MLNWGRRKVFQKYPKKYRTKTLTKSCFTIHNMFLYSELFLAVCNGQFGNSLLWLFRCVKSVQILSCFWYVFSHIRTEYGPEKSLRIQSDCEKIWTRNNSLFGHFSRSVFVENIVSDVLNTFSATLSKRDSFIRCFFQQKCYQTFFYRIFESNHFQPDSTLV